MYHRVNNSFFFAFLYSFIFFLYKFSTNKGTASIAVGFASCISGIIYLNPSHIATDEPVANGSRSLLLIRMYGVMVI